MAEQENLKTTIDEAEKSKSLIMENLRQINMGLRKLQIGKENWNFNF